MRGIAGSENKQELCLCGNFTVKILQMLLEYLKKNKKNLQQQNVLKTQEKKERDTFTNWDKVKAHDFKPPSIKNVHNYKCYSISKSLKNSRWKNGQFLFLFVEYILLPSQVTFISNRVKKKLEDLSLCSQKPCSCPNGWAAPPLPCYVPKSSTSIRTGYPVLTQ